MDRVAVGALAVAVAAAGSTLALPSADLVLAGAAEPAPWVIVVVLLGFAVLVVGSSLAVVAGFSGAAVLGLILGAGFAAQLAAGSAGLPALPRAVAAVMAFAATPALVQLTVGWPRFWPTQLLARAAASLAWLLVAIGIAWVMVWDPFSDASCVRGCDDNPLAVWPDASLARALVNLSLAITMVVAISAAVVAIRSGGFWPGGWACAAWAFDAGVRLIQVDPAGTHQATVLLVLRCAALALVGWGTGVRAASRMRSRLRIHALTASLEQLPPTGRYAESLGLALRDPSVSIAYPMIGETAFAHHDGSRFTGAKDGQVVTRLVHDGRTVAVVAHRVQHSSAISMGLGPAAHLLLDNERLAAENRARLSDLRESRARVVERAHFERLRLERDLHDGAQQRLLLLGHELRLAAQHDPSIDVAPLMLEAQEALQEVRSIAHGIYPGLLESLGLRAALHALADGPAWLELSTVTAARLPTTVERAAYRVVELILASLPDAGRSGQAPVTVAAVAQDERLVVTVEGFGQLAPEVAEEIRDHVGANNGRLSVEESRLVCELPCG